MRILSKTFLSALSLRICAPLILLALGFTSPVSAWDVTFTRDSTGNRTSSSFNLRVVLEQQTNAAVTSTETKGECIIKWNDSECKILGFPSSTNALVTVYHTVNPTVGQRKVIGKIAFWVGVFSDSEIHIPTGVASFKTDKTFSELATTGCCNVAILPQGNIEMGESYSDRPNSGSSFFGEVLGNCGSKDLASDQVAPSVCEVDFLAGCYSPVFARPITGFKAKIWVNTTDQAGDHVLCINEGETTDYLIKVQ